MRTVTLELLRHGPAHNQLLSPLTPYLALCENHAPVTLNVPFEHNQFLHRLSALTYEFGLSQLADNQRQFQLTDTGRELSRLLSAIPGLTAELNRHREESSEVIHLRLVLSASELALLPFELVLAGNGFPGFGQPLLLQNQAPICLTREVRRVKNWLRRWIPQARVLFIFASPQGLPEVPAEAHLLALRLAVEPWVGYFDEVDEDARREAVSRCLHVLPAASIGAIQEACASGDYTHIHILAHGQTRNDGFDLRFGIALHDDANPDGPADVVSGERLASALRPLIRPGRETFAQPMVVTLASCNGANGGSVVGAGASVAHALQTAGVPLVLAGQFPLTFEGSVELVETLYDGLLWGNDPRSLLMDMRRRMHVLQRNSHDWAALVAYASLPSNFEEQLDELVISRVRLALDVAMDRADRLLVDATRGRPPTKVMAEQIRERIRRPWVLMERLIEKLPDYSFELLGLQASLAKRWAEIELAVSMMIEKSDSDSDDRNAPRHFLALSRDDYLKCFNKRRDTSWALVQYICLALVLDPALSHKNENLEEVDAIARRQELIRQWTLAWHLSIAEVNAHDERAGWALGNLVELPLLANLLGIFQVDGNRLDWRQEADRRLSDLLALDVPGQTQIAATRRQLERWANWFIYVNDKLTEPRDWAEGLLKRIPR